MVLWAQKCWGSAFFPEGNSGSQCQCWGVALIPWACISWTSLKTVQGHSAQLESRCFTVQQRGERARHDFTPGSSTPHQLSISCAQHWASQHELFNLLLGYTDFSTNSSGLIIAETCSGWRCLVVRQKQRKKMSDRIVVLHKIKPVTSLPSEAAPILLLLILKLYTLNIQNVRSLPALSFLCSLQAAVSCPWCSPRQAFQLEQDEFGHP